MMKGGLDDNLSDHFGMAPTFTIFDTETKQVEIHANTSDHAGGTGKPPEQIKKLNADVVVCRGLGPNAVRMLDGYGIAVFSGASGSAKDAVDMYLSKKLSKATEETACKNHHH
jgi:predicted Fe-Mo cluster-binding NifX family protein